MPDGNPRTREEGERLEPAVFRGVIVERTANIQREVGEIKEENIRQWEAIDKAKWWNKIGASIALAALTVASWVGLRR